MELKVKCGRKEYTLDNTDLIMYNGACYQIVTKRELWNYAYPILAKNKAEKLIKQGSFIEANRNEKDELIYYKLSN